MTKATQTDTQKLLCRETDTQKLLRRGAGQQLTTDEKAKMDAEVKTNAEGYATGVWCELIHGGNIGLVKSMDGAWECQGCGSHVHVGTILERQRNAGR